MRVLRRRNGVVLLAELKYRDGAPILHIDGEPRDPNATDGYLLAEVSTAERAELRRWGYALEPADLVA